MTSPTVLGAQPSRYQSRHRVGLGIIGVDRPDALDPATADRIAEADAGSRDRLLAGLGSGEARADLEQPAIGLAAVDIARGGEDQVGQDRRAQRVQLGADRIGQKDRLGSAEMVGMTLRHE